MSDKTFRCHNCQEESARNPRIKQQKYCSKAACQRVRKTRWSREKYQNDLSYSKLQLERKKHWRDKYPAHEYQKNYRQSNPAYVLSNRESQKMRNQRNRASNGIIKDCKDGRVKENLPLDQRLYVLIPYNESTKSKIVKMDALIVQLADLQSPPSGFS